MLNCPRDEMKLKQNSFKTLLKLFCLNFISLCGQLYLQIGCFSNSISD